VALKSSGSFFDDMKGALIWNLPTFILIIDEGMTCQYVVRNEKNQTNFEWHNLRRFFRLEQTSTGNATRVSPLDTYAVDR
jgi:hypothetical protein